MDRHLGVPVGGGPVDAGPVPAGIDAIDAAACGQCHEEHYAEWRGSAHRSSFENRVFAAEFGVEGSAWCARCHAPRGDRSAGVDCATCHVRAGAVLNPRVSGRAPHASRAAPELAGQDACARCHEFDFEGQPGERLQRTHSEHRRSAHGATTCQGCHLPERAGRHRHDFPGGLDETLLRDAIEVTEARAFDDGRATRVTLRLRADGAGHAVPTGDVFRRILVRVWSVRAPDQDATATLRRTFRRDASGWHEVADRRVPARGSRLVELELPAGVDLVGFTIDLWRTPPERARRMGWAPDALHRRLASGAIEVTASRSTPSP